MKKYDAIIIGGGASGMMAAIIAARRDKNIAIIEKNSKLGRKILATGNGRCNISNKNSQEDKRTLKHYFGQNPKFVMSAFNQFDYNDTEVFFEELGINFKEEDGGRMFPVSNQAQSVLDVFEFELNRLQVKLITSKTPKEINYDNGFIVKLNDGQEISSKKLIVSTGGKTYPKFGTTGDGYTIAKQFGHSIIEQFPVYSGLIIKSPIFQKLQGIKCEASVVAKVDNKEIAKNTGTIMFAHFGLSAPGVLEISRSIAQKLRLEKKKVILSLNLLAFIKKDEVDKFLVDRWQKQPSKTLGFSFEGLLAKKIAPAFLESANIDPNQKVSEISKDLRQKIIQTLTNYQFEIIDVKDYDEAHFTAGGVNTKEINPKNLESLIQKNLFFCGEVLDIDGECGGYNLQWAWTSGYVVGINV